MPAPLHLIEGDDRIVRPGTAQRLVIPKITLDAPVVAVGTELRDGEWVYDIAEQVVGQYAGSNVVLAGYVGRGMGAAAPSSATSTNSTRRHHRGLL